MFPGDRSDIREGCDKQNTRNHIGIACSDLRSDAGPDRLSENVYWFFRVFGSQRFDRLDCRCNKSLFPRLPLTRPVPGILKQVHHKTGVKSPHIILPVQTVPRVTMHHKKSSL